MIRELLHLDLPLNYFAFNRLTLDHSSSVLCGLDEVPRIIMTVDNSTLDRFVYWGSPIVDLDVEAIVAFLIALGPVSLDYMNLLYFLEIIPAVPESLVARLQTWPSAGQRSGMPLFIAGLPAIKNYVNSRQTIHEQSIMRIERK